MAQIKTVILGLLIVAMTSLSATAYSAAPATSSSSSALIKPGARVEFADTFCTMNFVFKGSDGHKYVGTAGHCPLANSEGAMVWKPGKGIPASDSEGVSIGEFAFAAYSEAEYYDFALIRLKKGVRPDPQMEYFGGPTGLNDEITTVSPELINIFGQGTVVGENAPQRHLLAPNGFDDKETLFTSGASSPGDSGAPATTDDDEALGIVVAGGLYTRIPESGPPYAGVVRVVRLPFQIAFAEAKMGIKLTLLLAPPL